MFGDFIKSTEFARCIWESTEMRWAFFAFFSILLCFFPENSCLNEKLSELCASFFGTTLFCS
jgi:hypothetical protein